MKHILFVMNQCITQTFVTFHISIFRTSFFIYTFLSFVLYKHLGGKKVCDLGMACPFLHHMQHVQEYTHEAVADKQPAKRKKKNESSEGAAGFDGKGHLLGGRDAKILARGGAGAGGGGVGSDAGHRLGGGGPGVSRLVKGSSSSSSSSSSYSSADLARQEREIKEQAAAEEEAQYQRALLLSRVEQGKNGTKKQHKFIVINDDDDDEVEIISSVKIDTKSQPPPRTSSSSNGGRSVVSSSSSSSSSRHSVVDDDDEVQIISSRQVDTKTSQPLRASSSSSGGGSGSSGSSSSSSSSRLFSSSNPLVQAAINATMAEERAAAANPLPFGIRHGKFVSSLSQIIFLRVQFTDNIHQSYTFFINPPLPNFHTTQE